VRHHGRVATADRSRTSFDITVSTEVGAPSWRVYSLVTDIVRMGEWSPECVGGEWVDGPPGEVGSRFLGHNRDRFGTWTTECLVVEAEPPRRFAWAVLDAASPDARTSLWTFEVAPDGPGDRACVLTQRYAMTAPPSRLRGFLDRLDEAGQAEVLRRRRAGLEQAMRQTVSAIAAAAERDAGSTPTPTRCR
jgi:uncharacterized protein YndB with AHSA1/START domain